MDGSLVGNKLVWRNALAAQTPLKLLRIGAIRGGLTDYGQVDNLLLTVAPEAVVPLAVTLNAVGYTGGVFTCKFQSQSGVNHTLQYSSTLASGSWNNLTTIPGDGTLKTVTETNSASPRFYRIATQ